MKPSTLRILCGSATAALLAVGPVAIADAYAAPNVPQETAPGGDPCKADPNCSSGGATAPSGGAYQGSQPSNGQSGQTASPPPGQPGTGQPGSPPPSNGQSGGGSGS